MAAPLRERVAIEMRRQCGKATDEPWEQLSVAGRKRWLARADAILAVGACADEAERTDLIDALQVMMMHLDAITTRDALRMIGLDRRATFPGMPRAVQSIDDARAVLRRAGRLDRYE